MVKKELEEEEKLPLVKEKHEESHAGVLGTIQKLFHAGYYWPSMRRMVITVCRGCVVCFEKLGIFLDTIDSFQTACKFTNIVWTQEGWFQTPHISLSLP